MGETIDISAVEADAYRSRFDDGLIDLFIGLSAVWIGVAWLWLDDLAGLAGVLPAVLVVPFVTFRTRFVERRAGYVRFSARRRSWERRNLAILLIIGVVLFLVGIGAYLAFEAGNSSRDVLEVIAPGLIAFLLAVVVLIIAVASMLPRAFAYAGVLALAGAGAVAFDTNPGVPLLVSGAVITACGSILLVRFVRRHPTTG